MTSSGSYPGKPVRCARHRTLRFGSSVLKTSISLSRFISWQLASGGHSVLFQLNVDTERANFFQQYVERFRHACFHLQVVVDDVFVHLRPTVHVVRLHRQHFLQGVSSTVCFQCPHFHLTEALATELSFTT